MCRRPEMPRRRAAHGVARLVVVLFAVAGLAVTYGTGGSRTVIPCSAHDSPATPAQDTATHPVMSAVTSDDPYSHGPVDGDVPLAALVILLVLGLTGPRARIRQRPAGPHRVATRCVPSLHRAPSLAFLQVLRL